MALKTKITLLAGVGIGAYLLLGYLAGKLIDWRVFLLTAKIAAVVSGVVVAFTHYGWRVPFLSWAATSPNLRGTWRITRAVLHKLGPDAKPEEDVGYLVIRQTDWHIELKLFWEGSGVAWLQTSAPTAVNEGKVCFAGTYSYDGADRGFAAYFTTPANENSAMVLRYRNDSNETGEITLKGRVSRFFESLESAKAEFAKGASRLRKVIFALRWSSESGRSNLGVKLMRPGFGPPAEPAASSPSVTASRRLQVATRFFECPWRQPPRRSGFGTRDRPHSLHQGR